MKKYMILTIVFLVLLATTITACSQPDINKDIESDSFELGIAREFLVVGETSYLTFVDKPVNYANRKINWTSSDESVAVVSQNGLITAKSAGKVNILANPEGTINKKCCQLIVSDMVVSKDFEEGINDFGKYKFSTIQDAIDAAKAGDTIVVFSGNYNEDIDISKSLTIMGIDRVGLHSAKIADNLKVEFDNLSFYSEEYPKTAMIDVGKRCDFKIIKSDIIVDEKNIPEDVKKTGMGIIIGADATDVNIQKVALKSFDTGIYIHPTNGEVYITDNSIDKSNIGVVLDIRTTKDSAPENAEIKGEVFGNIYLDCDENSKFYYIGNTYPSSLRFDDYNKFAVKRQDKLAKK